MDLDFLAKIIGSDDAGKQPWAERAYREQFCPGSDMRSCYKPQRGPWRYQQINDPAGLIRSLHSSYCGGGSSHYAHSATHVR